MDRVGWRGGAWDRRFGGRVDGWTVRWREEGGGGLIEGRPLTTTRFFAFPFRFRFSCSLRFTLHVRFSLGFPSLSHSNYEFLRTTLLLPRESWSRFNDEKRVSNELAPSRPWPTYLVFFLVPRLSLSSFTRPSVVPHFFFSLLPAKQGSESSELVDSHVLNLYERTYMWEGPQDRRY